MATHPVPAQHRLFIARADWRDESQYPPSDLLDASIWAWEFLRRNAEYVRDYAICRDAFVDVPATPYPLDPLTHYLCEPDPTAPDMLYKDYASQHCDHFVYPVKDAVRHKWQINQMPDPSHTWEILLNRHPFDSPDHNQLAWLFACNTVDIINPPDRWTQRRQSATKVTGICVGNEILVRLDLTGNLDEQLDALRRQIAGCFKGGNRSGGLLVGQYPDLSRCQTAKYNPQLRAAVDTRSGKAPWPLPHYEPVIPDSPDWNKIPARQKSLHYILRMADAIASAEQGVLLNQLHECGIDVAHIGLTDEQPGMCEELFPAIAKALFKYFSLHPFSDDTRDVDYKAILRWLSLAAELVTSHDYAVIARMNMAKRKTKKPQSKTRG
ncbi:transcriptional regulator domain-containing protein [Paraburkholderia silvatlantica]|uniref:transcriptional regulator domain-containing protein n=1 Tax=Paraburkholderia silvatlantica TaxID=321895 RepID=UPI00105F46AA|nr:DUF6499 domain-containing protein [Paraburkholderia silvatlantica]TDQ93237.1 hypothetical protein C7412_109220 [Paraburkholderia silvatlantica]